MGGQLTKKMLDQCKVEQLVCLLLAKRNVLQSGLWLSKLWHCALVPLLRNGIVQSAPWNSDFCADVCNTVSLAEAEKVHLTHLYSNSGALCQG